MDDSTSTYSITMRKNVHNVRCNSSNYEVMNLQVNNHDDGALLLFVGLQLQTNTGSLEHMRLNQISTL